MTLRRLNYLPAMEAWGADTYDGSRDNADGILRGGRGSDVYILGRSFGNDTIDEGYLNSGKGDVDVVRLKSGLTASDVELLRTRDHLIIRVLSTDGITVDSTLTVKKHYVNDAAKIERVELSDGTKVFDINDFTAVKLTSAMEAWERIPMTVRGTMWTEFYKAAEARMCIYWVGALAMIR